MPVVNHPAFGGGSVNYRASVLSDDPDEQVSETIALMRRYVVEDAPALRREAEAALAATPGESPESAVWRWVRSRVSFVDDLTTARPLGNLDIPVVEVLIRPVDLSAMCSSGGCRRVGDCDDFSMYVAALLASLGRRVSFVTVAADPAAPQQFSHVYVASYPPEGGRVALDASHGPSAGWETPNAWRRHEWPINHSSGLAALVVAGAAAYFFLRKAAA